MTQRYLKKVSDGYIYAWTEDLSKKFGFIEVDEAEALKCIEDFTNRKKVKVESVKIENKVDPIADEPVEPIVVEVPEPPKEDEAVKDEIDDEILAIRNMRSKNEVEAYMLEKYQMDVDRRKSLGDLKNMALEEYEKRNDN